MEKLLNKAYNLMPAEFTSNEFNKKLRDLGIEESAITDGIARSFLQLNATQGTSSKMWEKIMKVEFEDEQEIDKAISFLKGKGYKIMKMVVEYEEV